MSTIDIGTVFTETESRPWRDNDGVPYRHTYTVKCRVTALTAVGFEWETLAVLDERDRPELGYTPERGSYAWFGFEAAMNRGDVNVLPEEKN